MALDEPRKRPDQSVNLSPRLSEILSLAAQGLTDKEIAKKLGLGVATVLSHWKRLRAHYATSSRTEIVARVLGSSTDSRVEELTEERRLLLFEMAERERLQQQLEEANQRLEEEVANRGEIMIRALAEYEKKHAAMVRRIEYLEKFHEVMSKFTLIPQVSDYGASFIKHWVGDTVTQHGYTPEEWVQGKVNIFEAANAEDLTWAMKQWDELTPGTERVVVTYRFKRADGEVRQFFDFILLEPTGATGVGKCHVYTIDLTDWLPLIKEKISQGWPDLPLRDQTKSVRP